jgi:hypothetical protein
MPHNLDSGKNIPASHREIIRIAEKEARPDFILKDGFSLLIRRNIAPSTHHVKHVARPNLNLILPGNKKRKGADTFPYVWRGIENFLHALSRQNNVDSFKHNFQVFKNIVSVYVVDIVIDLHLGIILGFVVFMFNLSQSGQAGSDQKAAVVIIDIFAQFADKKSSFGTRSDQAHIPSQDIEQLRDFIDAGGS